MATLGCSIAAFVLLTWLIWEISAFATTKEQAHARQTQSGTSQNWRPLSSRSL